MITENGIFKKSYDELLEISATMPIIDTHEHLPREQTRISKNVSFTDLFFHYCHDDFITSGMTKIDCNKMFAPETALEEKWRIFEPAYQNIKNGGYSRAARITMARFYDKTDLNTYEDALEVTEKIRKANKPGLYKSVLEHACHIENCMLFVDERHDSDYFNYVRLMKDFIEIGSLEMLESLESFTGGVYPTLDGYVEGIHHYLKTLAANGVRGLKFGTAYKRDLNFDMTTFQEAETVYNQIFIESLPWKPFYMSYDELRPLQNYLVNKISEFAGKVDLAVVFHTGAQAGNANNLDNCRPERLQSLFLRHPKTKFVLLHAGIPWCNEIILLAKYFPNVFVDLTWVHIISPQIAKTTIRNYIDMAPRNKLFGFGGDYEVIECVYGHLTMARENIATALAECVAEQTMSMKDAISWQQAMLYDNPKTVYKL